MSITFVNDLAEDPFENGDYVNLSNTNAHQVLVRLGYDEPEPYGHESAAEFRARVLCGLAMIDAEVELDDGVETVQDGNYVECGLRPGYFADVLGRLDALCAAGGVITWA